MTREQYGRVVEIIDRVKQLEYVLDITTNLNVYLTFSIKNDQKVQDNVRAIISKILERHNSMIRNEIHEERDSLLEEIKKI